MVSWPSPHLLQIGFEEKRMASSELKVNNACFPRPGLLDWFRLGTVVICCQRSVMSWLEFDISFDVGSIGFLFSDVTRVVLVASQFGEVVSFFVAFKTTVGWYPCERDFVLGITEVSDIFDMNKLAGREVRL